MASITLSYTGPGTAAPKSVNFANTDLPTVQQAYTYLVKGNIEVLLTPDEILQLLANNLLSNVQNTLQRYLNVTQPPPIPPVTQG